VKPVLKSNSTWKPVVPVVGSAEDRVPRLVAGCRVRYGVAAAARAAISVVPLRVTPGSPPVPPVPSVWRNERSTREAGAVETESLKTVPDPLVAPEGESQAGTCLRPS